MDNKFSVHIFTADAPWGVFRHQKEDVRALCVSGDAAVVEQVEACAAAIGCQIKVVSSLDQVRRWWRTAEVVLVGQDWAAQVAAAALPPGPSCRLVGDDQDLMVRWSAVLSAPVLVLPDQASTLSGVLAQSAATSVGGSVVRLIGASGGLGVSTLTAALAVTAARSGRRVAAVELAPSGGGLDLLFGAETVPGWRWPELATATGHLPDLGGRLPQSCGVDLVSAGRRWVSIPPAAAQAVLASVARSHDLVLVDVGRGERAVAGQVPGAVTWLLVGAEVRSVMAARGLAELAGVTDAQLVVRTGAGRHLEPSQISAALTMPLLGQFGDDKTIPGSAEAGEPPAMVRRGRWRRTGVVHDCRHLLSMLPEPGSRPAVVALPDPEEDRPTVSTRLRSTTRQVVAPRRSAGPADLVIERRG